LRKAGISIFYDESGSVGKRYRRQDEIGTPFCVTVDFDSLKDKSVTVRDRDTMKQERIEIKNVKEFITGKLI
jgi:glycyl-tRNA synthetase